MEKEQLGTLLRDLDALKQHPDDLASTIDRVSLPPGCPWISAVFPNLDPGSSDC
jgi:hypothetical protein